MTLDVLRRILSDEFDVEPDSITLETNFYDDLAADSLDMVELALACDENLESQLRIMTRAGRFQQLRSWRII